MRKIIFCALFIDFVIMILNIVELVHEGFFGDIYASVKIKDEITYFFWISLFLTVVIIFLLLFLIGQKQQKIYQIVKGTIVLLLFLLIVANYFFGSSYYTIVKTFHFEEMENQDYILSEYFRGISFDELQKDIRSNSEILIYIGKENCKQCKEFENKFEDILQEYYTEIPSYYTTQDRERSRRNEMYKLLYHYNISSIPAVILVQNSKVLKIWNNPAKKLDEIKNYV